MLHQSLLLITITYWHHRGVFFFSEVGYNEGAVYFFKWTATNGRHDVYSNHSDMNYGFEAAEWRQFIVEMRWRML